MTCPNPDCGDDWETFEVYTAYGVTGTRLYVDCSACDQTFEIEVLAQGPNDGDPR